MTALFTILNSLAFKPLPVQQPDRLVLLDDDSWTNPIWESIRDRQQKFADAACAWAGDRFNVSETATAVMVDGLWVSGQTFDVLGVVPVLGRTLTPGDDVRGGGTDGPVAVISHGMWQRRFGGVPGVIGRSLSIERVSFTIVGVTPSGFFGPEVGRTFDVAIPLGSEPLVRRDASALDRRGYWWLNIMARLKPGQTAEQATAALQAVQPQIRAESLPTMRRPEDLAQYLADPLKLTPAPGGRSPLRARYGQPLTVILAVVGTVLLIACANIANLLLARASARRHELTLRLALGASRFRIARQLLAESMLIASAGAILGLLLARWCGAALVSQITTFADAVRLDLTFDWRVLGFATAVTAAAAVLFGVAPAVTAGRMAPNEVLKERGRTGSIDSRFGVRHASLVLQVALSLTLVVAAGLFLRTFSALNGREMGFDRRGVLLVDVDVSRNPAREAARSALLARLRDAAAAVPGVAVAAALRCDVVCGRVAALGDWNQDRPRRQHRRGRQADAAADRVAGGMRGPAGGVPVGMGIDVRAHVAVRPRAAGSSDVWRCGVAPDGCGRVRRVASRASCGPDRSDVSAQGLVDGVCSIRHSSFVIRH